MNNARPLFHHLYIVKCLRETFWVITKRKQSSKSYFIEPIAYNYIGLKVLSSFSHGLDEFLFRIRAKFG